MRRFLVILCLLLNLSVLLMPFDTTHAHVSGEDPFGADVHSGHSHDLDPPHHDHETGTVTFEHVIDLQAAVGTQNTFQFLLGADWVPLACLAVLTLLLVGQRFLACFAPASSDPKPPSRHGYWRPPLRGPPTLSIR